MHHASESPGEVELLMGLMGWLSSSALKILPTETQKIFSSSKFGKSTGMWKMFEKVY